MSGRVPGWQRLRGLPELFSLHDLRMTGMPPGSDRVAVLRWKADGLVVAAGPRLGLFYNLVADGEGASRHLGEVVRRVYGTAVVLGPTVLHDNHWTTQIPTAVTVAVPEARSYPQIDGVAVYPRPPEWFACIRTAVLRGERGACDLRALPPEYALADMLRHGDCRHGLQPDDIEIPDEEVHPERLEAAFAALGVPADLYLPYVDQGSLPFAFR